MIFDRRHISLFLLHSLYYRYRLSKLETRLSSSSSQTHTFSCPPLHQSDRVLIFLLFSFKLSALFPQHASSIVLTLLLFSSLFPPSSCLPHFLDYSTEKDIKKLIVWLRYFVCWYFIQFISIFSSPLPHHCRLGKHHLLNPTLRRPSSSFYLPSSPQISPHPPHDLLDGLLALNQGHDSDNK